MMKILLPLDGSALAESAIAPTLALARSWEAEVLLLNLSEPFIPIGLGGQPELSLQVQRESLSASRDYLERIRDDHFSGLPVAIQALLGYPREEIAEVARREQCQWIVMASHGRTGPARWLLGSVAEAVLRHSPCPVLLIREQVPLHGNFQHILVPCDGSQLSGKVIEKLESFLASSGRITLLRATGLSFQERAQVLDIQAFERFLLGLEQELLAVETGTLPSQRKVVDGEATDSILEFASKENCDLIAMASHGRSGFRRLWLGSVTEKVARRSSIPLLVVPVGSDESN